MDKERARFVLQSFRPDGADAKDADFAEALLLATEDRELGGWLVRERAFDAEFAEALARVDLPAGLRESVLLSMVQDDADFPRVDMTEEGKWIESMAAIEIPFGLRERVLEAMEQTAKVQPVAFGWRRFAMPFAAAAGVALAFVFVEADGTRRVTNLGTGQVANVGNKVPVGVVQAGFFKTIEAPSFALEKHDEEVPKLVSYLQKRGLPCGKGLLPPGLKDCEGLGCRELEIDGKRGTLICFDDKDGQVHLVIFKRNDIKGNLPGIDKPLIDESDGWARATWQNEDYVFWLMGAREMDELAGLF